MNLCREQLFLVLTNSCATAQVSTTAASETVLPDINVPLTHTFSISLFTTGGKNSCNGFPYSIWYFNTFLLLIKWYNCEIC